MAALEHPRWCDVRANVLAALAAQHRWVAVLGPAGTGKTMLLRDIALSYANSARGAAQTAAIAEGPPILVIPAGEHGTALIDDADRLSEATLAALATPGGPQCVFAGPMHLADRLKANVPETIVLEFAPLSAEEARAYLALWLRRSELGRKRFANSAVSELIAAAAGVPRRLSVLAGRADWFATEAGARRVSARHVLDAAAFLTGGPGETGLATSRRARPPRGNSWAGWLGRIALGVGLAATVCGAMLLARAVLVPAPSGASRAAAGLARSGAPAAVSRVAGSRDLAGAPKSVTTAPRPAGAIAAAPVAASATIVVHPERKQPSPTRAAGAAPAGRPAGAAWPPASVSGATEVPPSPTVAASEDRPERAPAPAPAPRPDPAVGAAAGHGPPNAMVVGNVPPPPASAAAGAAPAWPSATPAAAPVVVAHQAPASPNAVALRGPPSRLPEPGRPPGKAGPPDLAAASGLVVAALGSLLRADDPVVPVPVVPILVVPTQVASAPVVQPLYADADVPAAGGLPAPALPPNPATAPTVIAVPAPAAAMLAGAPKLRSIGPAVPAPSMAAAPAPAAPPDGAAPGPASGPLGSAPAADAERPSAVSPIGHVAAVATAIMAGVAEPPRGSAAAGPAPPTGAQAPSRSLASAGWRAPASARPDLPRETSPANRPDVAGIPAVREATARSAVPPTASAEHRLVAAIPVPDVAPERLAAAESRQLPAPGLLLIVRSGETLTSLYAKVYKGVVPPPFSAVAAANPRHPRAGDVLVFPPPPGGWKKQRIASR